MATREEIAFIREARSGKAPAQLILGKYYLSGGAGLKKNIPTALYWLYRAAARNEQEAWIAIGTHVPFEIAVQSPDQAQLCVWYERAYDAGVVQAGLVWAKLLLSRSGGETGEGLPRKAVAALEKAADSGIVEAQWILAKELKRAGHIVTRVVTVPVDAANDAAASIPSVERAVETGALDWATRAAANGVLQAQRALADRAWSMQDRPGFLRWLAPVARAIADQASSPDSPQELPIADAEFLSRCARTMYETGGYDAAEIERLWELAAQAGDKDARFRLGLWCANMEESGERVLEATRKSNYKKAMHWLTRAGDGGVANAWYALYKICVRPNTGLTHISLTDAQRYLERAAEAGHCAAQLELGAATWRVRRNKDTNDVVAAYWLQKAAAQGSGEALELLRKIATRATPAPWAQAAQKQLTYDLASTYPFLAARLELAALFGLSLPEALLLDVSAADQGHCLLIDVRTLHARSKRRLILIQTGEERLALTRIARHFANIDCGPNGPEGNYRQRLYIAKKLFPASAAERKAMLKSEVKPV
jgi:TPR repeat protein